MKLYFSPASPFVRKVRMVAAAKSLTSQIELLECALTPVNPNENVIQDNPLGKIPALYADDVGWLYDSRVICEFLDQAGQGEALFPSDSSERWAALRLQSIGDGICDAAILARYESLVRPENLRSEAWVEAQLEKVKRSMNYLEANTAMLKSRKDIGGIAIACCLGYLDFRYKDMQWRESWPNLADVFQELALLPGFEDSSPE